MKNILVHLNDGDPVYNAMSEDVFHVIYQKQPIGSHRSLGLALESASEELINSGLTSTGGWHAIESE